MTHDRCKNIDLLNSQTVCYILNCQQLMGKLLSDDLSNGHWLEDRRLTGYLVERGVLSHNRKSDGSRLTGSTEACIVVHGMDTRKQVMDFVCSRLKEFLELYGIRAH